MWFMREWRHKLSFFLHPIALSPAPAIFFPVHFSYLIPIIFASVLLSIPLGPAQIWHIAMGATVWENVLMSRDVINYRHHFPLRLSEEDRDVFPAGRWRGEEKGRRWCVWEKVRKRPKERMGVLVWCVYVLWYWAVDFVCVCNKWVNS